tara:strand:- start:266 stop:1219 length:954 start_codon:yes stop_codon:yes gene_type:complete
MIKKFEAPKYIIILGTTYSGSGAIFDYLVGRNDLHNPLKGEEYLLSILPNGFMDLEAAAGKAFVPETSEYHIIKFREISEKLSNFWSNGPKKKELRKFSKQFNKNINQLMDDIVSVDYPMKILWRELLKSPLEKNLTRIKNLTGMGESIPPTRLLVPPKKFVKAVEKMHDNLFKTNSDKRPTILSQAGSGWNPIESTKYFDDRKTILITRDPRDQYLEIKKYKKGQSVMGFVDWYKEMQSRLKSINDENILQVRFEDFVNNNKKYTKIICDYLNLSDKVESNYRAELSKKNVYKFKDYKDHKEIQLIEDNLKDFLYN